MPTYDITVEENGQIYDLVIEGDREPTDSEVMEVFRQSNQPQSLTPEVDRVSGGLFLLDRALAPLRGAADGLANMDYRAMAERFLSAMGETGDISGVSAPPVSAAGTPERAAEIKGYQEGFARVAPMIAGAQMGSVIPTAAGMVAGPLSVAGQGLLGAATEQAITQAPQIVSGKPVTSALVDAAVPVAAATVAGPVLMGAGRLAMAGAQAVGKAGGFTKNLVANLNRPVEINPEQLRALRSRDLVETATGQRIPLGLAEAINTKSINGNLRNLTAELSPETLSTIEQAALHVVANTTRSGRTSEALSPLVYDILDAQKTGLNDQAKEAANGFIRKYIGAVNKAEEQVTGAAKSIFGGRSFAQIGKDIRAAANEAFQTSKAEWDKAYDAAKAIPGYDTLVVDMNPVKAAAQQAGLAFAKNSSGGLSVLGTPAGAKAAISGAEDLAGTASVEQTRQLISDLGKNIYNSGYLPGVDIRVKLDILNAAKDSLDAAVSTVPTLQSALKNANKLYSDNIGRFKNSLGKGILSDFGEQGGATPEAIIRKLTGADAESNLTQLTELLGSGSPLAGKGEALVREAILSKAAGTGSGKVNVGSMVGLVESLPKPVQDRLFPSFATARQLLRKESALATLSEPESVGKFLDELEIDATTLEKALGGETAPLIAAAKAAAKKEADIVAELNTLGLDGLKDRSSFELKKWISSPKNQSRIRNTLDQLAKKNPDLVNDTKALFLDDIIRKASLGDVFDPVKFRQLIGDTILPTGPGAPGVAPGEYSEAVESVFGPKIKKELTDIAASLGDIPRPGDVAVADKGLFHYLFFGYTGGPVVSTSPNTVVNAIGRLTNVPELLRYKIAAHFLTDDTLRRAAMEPLNANSLRALDKAVRATAVSVGAQFGKRSEQYKELQDLDAAIQPGVARYTPPQFTPPTPTVQPTPEPVEPPQEVEVGIPNQYGRTVTKKLTRDSARKALEEQRALLQKYRQQLQ